MTESQNNLSNSYYEERPWWLWKLDPQLPIGSVFDQAAFGTASRLTEFLVKKGVDVNAIDENGNSLLGKAAQYGNLECTKLLLSMGADPNRFDPESGGHSPAAHAVMSGCNAVVEALREAGANFDLPSALGATANDWYPDAKPGKQ